ncbi:hypothetical protein M422DRAFT_168278 [Sphaerobolus stellatus SS14]|uniref:RING-type domain-containing protein n=1 Tax=Sphaerobolus stellatus (strain SS14) TaxID=990650 RepID=A0A0C9UMT1_SPHS4|nr:hypothetical protein M422DRAFT_168278 [Sphaerobolus stellatus SS14]
MADLGPPPQQSPYSNLPGPWAFVTSGYAVSLVIMGLLLNRIQHMVVPPRHSLMRRLTQHYGYMRRRQSSFRAFVSMFFPINLNSVLTRAVFRGPSMYLLWRSLIQFFIILLQTSNMFPSLSWLSPAAEWGSRTEMKEVCWNTFIAVCVALAVEALMKGLEGRSNPPSPFNLFGYAFLLHIYSSPVTHQVKTNTGSPSRPDKHVLITIIIPLLQLTMIHSMGIRRRWASQRLVPTTICGLLTLLHFHYVYFFSPTPYPLINYLPSVLESILLFIILLTISLHLLTQLLLEGRISQPFLGHYRTLAPRWDEDFAVALLRVGTASLDATSAAGLGNEVVGIGASLPEGPEVEIGHGNKVNFRGPQGGFGNEVKRVKVAGSSDSESWTDGVSLREWVRFFACLWTMVKVSVRLLYKALRRRLWGRDLTDNQMQPTEEERKVLSNPQDIDSIPMDSEDLYQRFLRGETLTDDEDGEYDAASHSPSPSPSISDTEEEYGTEEREAVDLYNDISKLRAKSPPLAPVLLAHVTNPPESPLTRRRYNRLLSRPEDGWPEFIQERRAANGNPGRNWAEEGEDRSRTCVVCTVEQREIVCWPCRCFALCDDCRGNLASRFPASKHTCPCCRRNVDGYSRIYIP